MIKDKLCLQNEDIQNLFEYFRLLDRYDRSYIDFDDFVANFRKDMDTFVELPFAERLFKCIPKSQ